jgi:hypothetical protein
MRDLSYSEQRFLIWAYVTTGRRAPLSFDDVFGLMKEWEDMSGEKLPDDFLNHIMAIYTERYQSVRNANSL